MSKWEHGKLNDEELKKLVCDVYDQKILTSLQCGEMTSMVFIPIIFMGSAPSKPILSEATGNIRKDRRNKLNHFKNLEQWKKDLKQWKIDTPKREEYFKNIGMVYEYMDKAGPRSVNGYPMFMSINVLSIEETKKFADKYNKYIKLREKLDKSF